AAPRRGGAGAANCGPGGAGGGECGAGAGGASASGGGGGAGAAGVRLLNCWRGGRATTVHSTQYGSLSGYCVLGTVYSVLCTPVAADPAFHTSIISASPAATICGPVTNWPVLVQARICSSALPNSRHCRLSMSFSISVKCCAHSDASEEPT